MAGVQFDLDTTRLAQLFGGVGGGRLGRALGKNVRAALRANASAWEARMKRYQLAPYRGRSYPAGAFGRLQSRSGQLRSSIGYRLAGDGLNSSAVMYSTSETAPIHEFGGRIHGKPWLAIPLPNTLKPSGAGPQARFETHRQGSKWVTGRGLPTFIKESRAGNLIVFASSKAKRGRPTPLKVLKRSVDIPAGRLGFVRTWRNQTRAQQRRYREAIVAALRGQKYSPEARLGG